MAVYPSGAKAFLIYRRVHRRPERIFIGRWPDLTVEQARKIAEQMNGLIAKGENPASSSGERSWKGRFRTCSSATCNGTRGHISNLVT